MAEPPGGPPGGSGPPGGAGGGSKKGGEDEEEEPEVVIEGMHITEHNVNSLRNAKIRAEARLGLKRQRKQPLTAMYSTSSLPEKILDMHGNKTSNPEAPDATVVVDVEKLQKKCLGLGTPSFLERVKMEFELKQKARATAAAAASSSSSRPGTAPGSSVSSPSNFIKRNKERVDQARLSEREKVYADLRNQRSAKELRVNQNLISAKREQQDKVIRSGVSYLNRMAYLQEEGKYTRHGLTFSPGKGDLGKFFGGGKAGRAGHSDDENDMVEELTEEWRLKRWLAVLLQTSYASIMHRLLLNNSPDARKRYNENKWCQVVRVMRFRYKIKKAVRGSKNFRFLFRIAKIRYRLLIRMRLKKFHAKRILHFLVRTTPSVPIMQGLRNFYRTVHAIQRNWRIHLSLLKPFVKRAAQDFEVVEKELLKELQTYVQIERPVLFAKDAKRFLGKTEPTMLSGRLLNDRDSFQREYGMPAEVRDAFLTSELTERLYIQMQRDVKQKAAFRSSMGFIHEYTTFWQPVFEADFFELLKDQVKVEADDGPNSVACSLLFTKHEIELLVVAMHRAMGILPDAHSKLAEEIDHDPKGFQTENAQEFKKRFFYFGEKFYGDKDVLERYVVGGRHQFRLEDWAEDLAAIDRKRAEAEEALALAAAAAGNVAEAGAGVNGEAATNPKNGGGGGGKTQSATSGGGGGTNNKTGANYSATGASTSGTAGAGATKGGGAATSSSSNKPPNGTAAGQSQTAAPSGASNSNGQQGDGATTSAGAPATMLGAKATTPAGVVLKMRQDMYCRSMRERLQRRQFYFLSRAAGVPTDGEGEGEKEKPLVNEQLVLQESTSVSEVEDTALARVQVV